MKHLSPIRHKIKHNNISITKAALEKLVADRNPEQYYRLEARDFVFEQPIFRLSQVAQPQPGDHLLTLPFGSVPILVSNNTLTQFDELEITISPMNPEIMILSV